MLIVEKELIDLNTGEHTRFYAVCSQEPLPESDRWSLTYEGYLTPWTNERPTQTAAKGVTDVSEW